MSDQQQDPELRARFEELRRVDASRAPSFADVMARAQAEATGAAGFTARRESRVTLRRLGWAGGLAAAAAIAALIVIPRAGSDEQAFEQAVQAFQANPALGGWRSPTDGLLNLPGSRLISTIPSVGTGQQ
jgi:ferric-dicitrate binding protein FerR (iron transport regulator)